MSNTTQRQIATVAVAAALFAAGAAAAYWYLRSPAGEPKAAPAVAPAFAPPAPSAPPPAVPEQAPLPAQPGAKAQMLALPDGSRVPLLNGVTVAPELTWGDEPWSPIVRTIRTNGIDWYEHANGSQTTTMMVWRAGLGRLDATAICAHPRAPAPVESTAPSVDPRQSRR
jgi:hypothetical protein